MYSIDLPVILSQDYCGFLEPQELVWRGDSGKGYHLKNLIAECPEVLEPFNQICGFSMRTTHYKNKTLFRFPLRNKASKLSSEVYDIVRLHKLLDSLKEEAQYLLVFLRSVCSIEICQITESNVTESLFRVSVSQKDYQSRLMQQQQLVNEVESTFSVESPYSMHRVVDISRFDIEIVVNGSITGEHEWIVVNQVGSDNGEVMHFAEKQHVLPWVGTAIDLSKLCLNGRIFCVLPLPVEDRVPLCVHVNGTFAVSSNRRSLQWEAQERKGDEEGIWNKLLVKHCLPSCYLKLVSELMTLSVDPDIVYACWPNIQRVSDTPWSSLLEPFYQSLLLRRNMVVYTQMSGTWIGIREAVFINDDVPMSVKDAIAKCSVNLVEVNNNCSQALGQYYNGKLTTLQPVLARSYLKRNPRAYHYASKQAKMEILKYCLKDNAYHDLAGLELIPLVNGSFQQFERSHANKSYVCTSADPSSLLLGLENKLVSVYDEDEALHSLLCSLARSGYTQLAMLETEQVANLLPQCNTRSWPYKQMAHFWKWLNRQSLSHFCNKLIVPTKSLSTGHESVVPLTIKRGVVYIPLYASVSRSLSEALEKCSINFANANDFSYLSHPELIKYLNRLEPNEVLDAMSSCNLAVNSFSSHETIAMQEFFSNAQFSSINRVNIICKLPLFKVLHENSTWYAINSIATLNANKNAIAMRGTYSFRSELLPDKPLIIDTKNNVSNLLENLSSCVCFMTETEYLLNVAFQQIAKGQFNNRNIVPFMKSVLDNIHYYRRMAPQLTEAMKILPFIEVQSSSILEAPLNLFDPDIPVLKQLFLGEGKFPASSFWPHLSILRECGLKSSVSASEIFQIVAAFQKSLSKSQRLQSIVTVDQNRYLKAVAVLKYLSANQRLFNSNISNRETLLSFLRKQYFWLPVASSPPGNYPSSLEWKGSQYELCLASASASPLVVLSQDLTSSELPLIMGSAAVFIENTPSLLTQNLYSSPKALVPAVISHFKHMIEHEGAIPHDTLQSSLLQIYTYLLRHIQHCNVQQLQSIKKWLWVEKFIDSSQAAIAANPSFRSSLEPFIYLVPPHLQKFSQLFAKCGIQHNVTNGQILAVLWSIKSHCFQITDDGAWSIVRAILDWIADDTNRMNEGNLLVPVESDSSYPQLLPIEDVAYTDNEMLRGIANVSNEKYNLIHPKVFYLSSKLGLSPLSDHLDITEDVFEDAGQHEPLTTRLSNILREYKDGLTIIKEMIQNADDAGASEVNILYDTRTHSSQNLLFKGMAESHGPALVVHNNSTFTKEDFENITKLAGATKANQPLKIGKFGVGFCSVYHITDVPSFVSGEWLYMFDPTLKYLKGVVHNESRPGKKLKYQSRFLARSQQLAPYQGLFDFDSSSNYNGTMFRLPFRTHPSQICSTIYNDHLVKKMKDDLEANGTKLLLFLRNVNRITFSSMHGNKPVIEVSIECHSDENGIKRCCTDSLIKSTEYWLLSCQEAKLKSQEGDYKQGVASVACKLVKEESSFLCEAIEGNAFCFLPLSVPATGLPVHITANFAVMSNRSGIWTGASSAMASDSREYWNKQLMTTLIPQAYCNLLKRLQAMHCSGKLLSYEFYMLWPLTFNLQIRFPWESLISVLFGLVKQEKLFYSLSACKWLELSYCHFLPSSLFQIQIDSESTCFIEAVKIMQLPTVFLPSNFLYQLKQLLHSTVNIITENQFAQVFLERIHLFHNHTKTRNEVISMMLSAIGAGKAVLKEYKVLKSLLEKHPCIPTSPQGLQLKRAAELVDSYDFRDMFDPEDGMFPEKGLYQVALVREGIVRLGLMSSYNVRWDVIIKSAKTVTSLFQKKKEKALVRIKVIIECIDEKAGHTPDDYAPPEFKQTCFLPVWSKPESYILPWKGDGHLLLPPCQMISVDSRSLRKMSVLVGSQKAIVNTKIVKSGGCDAISHRALKLMDVPSRPSFHDVHNQFICLVHAFNSAVLDYDQEIKQTIEEICRNVYEHFEMSLAEEKSPKMLPKVTKYKKQASGQCTEILSTYHNKPFIWTGKGFVSPCDVSINWKQPEGPYLYKLPGMLSQHKNLVQCLQVKESFSIDKLLNTLCQMYECFKPTHRLPKEYHETARNIIFELNSTGSIQELSNMKEKAILVDSNYILRPANQLAFNDAAWLPPDSDCNYVISLLIREKALALGVQPTSSKFLDKYTSTKQSFSGIPFGQREELTQRIKNILHDYPLDVTFLKELLQNADDAKASKMCVILDKRQHKTVRVPSEKWAELQGPAILIWNDKEFSDKDLQGIQKLGLGSKRDDDESIGQFGIGFNVVYHVTDCPSFITRGDTLCVFDPHCRYVHGADKLCPGRQYNIDDTFWDNMSDLRSCFLQDSIQKKLPELEGGVLFRFPLRSTKAQVMNSELVNNPVKTEPLTVDVIEERLKNWVLVMKDSLLFLNHIIQFEYYIIEESGLVKCERSYEVNLDDGSHKKRASLKEKFVTFKKIKAPFLITYPLTLKTKLNSQSCIKEHWLIQQGVGDVQDPSKHWVFLNRTIPKHGIAATIERSEDFKGQVFCFLPLPLYTDLPVHINGQFVLNTNRRTLWVSTTDERDDKSRWNDCLIEAIASSYVHFLNSAKQFYVNVNGYDTLAKLFDAINDYYSLFPFYDPAYIYKKNEESSEMPYRSGSGSIQYTAPRIPRSNQITKKRNWKGICNMVFKLMWAENSQLLAVELRMENSQKDSRSVLRWVVKWHKLCSDAPRAQAYFQSTVSKEVKKVLRELGMTLTCAPHIFYTHLQSDERTPAILSRDSVYKYYSKFHPQIIGRSPCLIEHSPFKSVNDFCAVFKYLVQCSVKGGEVQYEFPDIPIGIPLLLTADSQLQVFTTPPRVLCSNYSHLFQKSSSLFLHKVIIDAVGKLSKSYFVSQMPTQVLDEIMTKNFSSALRATEVDNTDFSVISMNVLKELWMCLNNDPIISQHQQHIVKHWAIIPSSSGVLFSANSLVLPLYRENKIFEGAYAELVKLGVPLYDSNNYAECIAKDYCIDLSVIPKVLSVLFYHHNKTKILCNLKNPRRTIPCLFEYFGRINFSYDDNNSLQFIQSLPLFETVNGDITSLRYKKIFCWPEGACKAGHDKWASSERVVFLHKYGDWKKLCDIETLGGQDLTERDLYIQFIFPAFNMLTPDERLEHLKHIKETMFSDIQYESQLKKNARSAPARKFLNALKNLPCLEAKNGDLRPIREFSDHNMEIFTIFSNYFLFVPKVYQEDYWLDFLVALDLQVTISIHQFKSFANLIATGQHNDVSKASSVLVSYLFSESAKEWHSNMHYFSDIANIAFVKVDSLIYFEWIKKPCQAPLYLQELNLGLTKLNQAVVYDSASLIWTVKPVVTLPVPSYMYFRSSEQYLHLLRSLNVTLRPNIEDVFQNLINVSRTGLAKFELFHRYNSAYTVKKETGRVCIEVIIKQCFDYLFECKADEQLKNLQTVPCIPVSAIKTMNPLTVIHQPVLVKPLQVVRYIPDDCSHLFPYLHIVPNFLVGYHNLKALGVSDNITVKTIQYLLQTIYEQFSNKKLDPNCETTVREAVIKMHHLLLNMKCSIKDISPLYYPNSKGCLVDSTGLIFVDSTRYRTGIYDFSGLLYSLFQLPHLARMTSSSGTLERIHGDDDICLQLPKEVRPHGLSLICREELLNRTVARENNSPLYLHFMKLKSIAPALQELLPKILLAYFRYQAVKVNESTAKHFTATLVESFITRVKVTIIKDLKSKVFVNDKSVATIKVKYLFHKDDQNDEYDNTLYVDTRTSPSSYTVRKEMAHTLCVEVARLHDIKLTSYLKFTDPICECLAAQSIDDLMPTLEKLQIDTTGIDIRTIESTAAVVGGKIPDDLIDLLENDINHIFHPEEWVGYENEDGDFIYAVVLYTVPQIMFNPFERKYVITIDVEGGDTKEVSTLDLYKLMRVSSGSLEEEEESQELVLSDVNSATAQVRRVTDSFSLLELKRAIIRDLELIWALNDEDERRKAVKRLYLQYHPDKNNPNEVLLYEEAFKFLKQQIDRLEAGKPLENPDAQSSSSAESTSQSYSYWSRRFDEWEEDLKRRRQRSKNARERSYRRENEGVRHGITQPQADPDEARYWLKQAESDYNAMLILNAYEEVQCQILFLAHEACEKALKAGKYKLVGLNPASLKTHELVIHAFAIAGVKDGDWAVLPSLVSSMEQYYVKTRCPNQHHPSVAPADVYSHYTKRDEIENAVSNTKKLIKLIQRLF